MTDPHSQHGTNRPRQSFHSGRRGGFRIFCTGLAAAIGALATVPTVSAQRETGAARSDSVTVAAGPHYAAGPLRQRLLGSDYRDLWTTPVRVPVLDLRRFAGGLTPLREGGGRQTMSLRLMGADGREYAFRSVDKIPALAVHPDLDGSLLGHLIQDQASSMLPAAPLAAAHLSAASGTLHSLPTLFIMPDDGLLGGFRERFGGMLGTLEEFPNELENGGGFAGADRIAGTESMLDNVEESADHRIDSRAFLAARLTDLIMGDWDRHEGQWRWARNVVDGRFLWTPIARDRDYAFANYDGVLLRLVRQAVPNAVRFEERYTELSGLMLNAREIDRRVLSDLERPAWDSVTAEVQARLTDAVIESALAQLPDEYLGRRGDELASKLRSRRDNLPEAAGGFYASLAQVTVIRATDGEEGADVTRYADGSVEVRVQSAGEPYYRRLFHPSETSEIRLYLQGGNDAAIVRGAADRGILVRVIGGGGNDMLVDSSTVRRPGRWTTFHDSGSDDRLIPGPVTTIDRRAYQAPQSSPRGLIRIPPADAGTSLSFQPTLDYSTTRGAILGGGMSITRYAFRRHPFASRFRIGVRYASRWKDFGLIGRGEFHGANPALSGTAEVEATRIGALRFYGFGNESRDEMPSKHYVVRRELLSAEARLRYAVSERASIWAGPIARLSRPRPESGSPLAIEAPLGVLEFGAIGGRAGVGLLNTDTAASAVAYRLELSASALPVLSNGRGTYGDLRADGAVGIPLAGSGAIRVNTRGGAQYVWGEYPFYDAAFLGGRQTLRGLPQWRLAGDAMVYGGTEAVAQLGRLPLVMNWRLSGFVFTDLGRVFLAGEDSRKWHAAPGVGVSLQALDYTVRASYAHGPKGRVYVETRAPL